MRIPFMGRLRKEARKRAFLRANPDVRAIYEDGWSRPKKRVAPAPLSDAQMAQWNDNGVLVLKGFFEPSVVEAYKRHIDTMWQTRARPENPLVMYSSRGEHYFRDAIDEDRAQTYRLLDHYMIDTPTRNLCMDPRLAKILHQLMGYTPVVCNSLLFEYGSEQDMHSDMFYMAPHSENQMLATWIAFDDVTQDNGPLIYVPGSHKLPPHRFSHGRVQAVTEEVEDAAKATLAKIATLGLPTERFFAEKGDLLIWHSQLVHGGDAIRDKAATRTSLVTHYYSTCDVPAGPWFCAERKDGTMLLMKEHLKVA